MNELIFTPTALAVDEAKDNRLYWADPKFHKVETILPDGTS